MRKNLRSALRTAAVATAGAAALALPAAPATAADEPAPEPQSRLLLTMSPGVFTPGSTFSLECRPPGGDHPDPVAACAELAAVDGDFDKLEPTGTMGCHTVRDPVTVTATGTWHGREVSYTETFASSCAAIVATNFVFRL